MLLCDTSGLLAYFDQSDRHFPAVNVAIESDEGPFVVSPYVLAELDHFLATRRGVAMQLAVLRELASGAWELPCLDGGDLTEAFGVIGRYRDHDIGLADASLVVLAKRYQTNRLLSLDQRHFSAVRTLDGSPFTLLP
jgi:uncharacterized protein